MAAIETVAPVVGGLTAAGGDQSPPAHVEVLIVGAGLSGIGAACHLERNRPGTDYLVLEARDAMGGTWDLFRYPGIRSDSDMYTLGYSFKPWTDPKAIADGPSILSYIRDTAAEYDVERHIRYGRKVVRAHWSTPDELWSVEVEHTATGERSVLTAGFVLACTGYYDYEHPHDPDFPGRDDFGGTIVHPQFWPEDLEVEGKRIVVIGSGATAVTLVPALADRGAQVTMLQRSPTYMVSLPEQDVVSNTLRRWLPEKLVYRMARGRNVTGQLAFYKFSRARPERARRLLLGMARRQLGSRVDMVHFTPTYDPWDERLCALPDGDLFAAVRRGRAEVVTDQIETFTTTGIRLVSGAELPADVIVTATGLRILMLGGIEVRVDGRRWHQGDRLNYKGIMFEDLPNLAMVFGYTNASWTLKADISAEWVCRLLEHMERTGTTIATPRRNDPTVMAEDFVDMTSGYLQRAKDELPKQGSKAPWRVHMNYARDWLTLHRGRIDDGVLEFAGWRRGATASASDVGAGTA
jgi:cation diffusion facilitator CzcD-associated flavoprotein CzcO